MKNKYVEIIAAATHEANRAYCLGIGDSSQVHWADAPQWQKDSAIKGVILALSGASPEESHNGWLAEKRKDGWVWGPTKDASRKTHPCMVGYSELPPEQRLKDEIFISTVLSMAILLEV